MKVLHVITGLGAGGAEQQLRLLVRNLPPECRSEVVTLGNAGVVAKGLRADGVRVADLRMRGNRDLAALPRLVRLIRRGGYDVVHCHLYRACVYGRIAARLAGVPAIVTTEHSLLGTVIEGRRTTEGIRLLYRATELLGHGTVAVSQSVADSLAEWGVPGSRIVLIPNGVDAARYRQPAPVRAAGRQSARAALGLPQDAFVIGGLGRLVPGKRFDVLIDALALMPHPAARTPWLLLVGEGVERAALERRARAAGVAERVVFAGERDDVPELLTAMDVLAAPSEAETFGLALIEGLAAGLPVRWSSGPALAELPGASAPGARRLASDPQAYAADLGALSAGRPRSPGRAPAQPEAVRHYDAARLALEVADLYRRLARRPSVPRPASPVPSVPSTPSVPEVDHVRP
jgi:glycosyltransferase involved in cell wall biosynthesis